MRKLLRILAIVVALGGLAYWLAEGANRGWTKNRVEQHTVDEVTGIESVAYVPGFKPGVDFLAAIGAAAAVLAGASFVFRKPPKSA